MNALGTHVVLELKGCSPRLLDDLEFVRRTLFEAAQAAGAQVVGHTFHKFSPHGVTGVVVIAESHICIHTWPEYGYAAADIFTCGNDANLYKATQLIIERFQSREPSIIELRRGLLAQPVVAPR